MAAKGIIAVLGVAAPYFIWLPWLVLVGKSWAAMVEQAKSAGHKKAWAHNQLHTQATGKTFWKEGQDKARL